MDVAAHNLDIVHRLGRKMAAEMGADFNITATTDRHTAIADADFVLTTFRQGKVEVRGYRTN